MAALAVVATLAALLAYSVGSESAQMGRDTRSPTAAAARLGPAARGSNRRGGGRPGNSSRDGHDFWGDDPRFLMAESALAMGDACHCSGGQDERHRIAVRARAYELLAARERAGQDSSLKTPQARADQFHELFAAAQKEISPKRLPFWCPRWLGALGETPRPKVARLTAADMAGMTAQQFLEQYACTSTVVVIEGCIEQVDRAGQGSHELDEAMLSGFAGALRNVPAAACTSANSCGDTPVRPPSYVQRYLRSMASGLESWDDVAWLVQHEHASYEDKGLERPPLIELHVMSYSWEDGNGGPSDEALALMDLVAPRWKCGALLRGDHIHLNDIRFARRGFVIGEHADHSFLSFVLHPYGAKNWTWSLGFEDLSREWHPLEGAERVTVHAPQGSVVYIPYMMAHRTECVTEGCISMNM